MTAYILLLIPVALLSYLIGSLDTMVLTSNFIFHRHLARLGTGNLWLSNFRRIYGFKGFVLYGLVEIIKDVIPILFGALMLSFKEHPDAGRMFAAFCMVLGSLFPIYYGFKGRHAAIALVVAGFAMESTVGIAAAAILVIALAAGRYMTIAIVAETVFYLALAAMTANNALLRNLALFTAAAMFIKHIPAVIRLLKHQEERLTLKEDLSYKLDT